MNIYMGQSFQEKRIFVDQNDYNKSLELIELFLHNEEVVEEKKNETVKNDDEDKKYILIKRAWVWLILGISMAIIILSIMAIIFS